MARILVVDDDVAFRRTIGSILERDGHSVVLAERGHDGAAAIEAFAFDVAVVDIFTPGMSGLETITLFRQNAPTLPIVVVSGYVFCGAANPAPDFFRMAVDLGAAACLRKPIRPAALLRVVNDCCRAAGACKVA